jgi:hypothetical protein
LNEKNEQIEAPGEFQEFVGLRKMALWLVAEAEVLVGSGRW